MKPALMISALPGDELVVRQGVERGEVDEHRGGLVEGPDEVLARRGVDAGLPADRGVDHRQQRGGDVDHPHAAHPGGGDEAREVGGRAPAECDHDVRAGEPDPPADLPAEARDGEGLALLGVGDLHAVGLDAGLRERAAHLFRGLGEGGLVDEQRVGGAEVRDGGGQLGAHVAADQHRVGPLALTSMRTGVPGSACGPSVMGRPYETRRSPPPRRVGPLAGRAPLISGATRLGRLPRQWWWPWRPRVSTGVAPGRVHCGTGRLVGPQVATPSASERQYQQIGAPCPPTGEPA